MKNTLLVWFFCILLSSSMRAKDAKEGDRMGHRDDVLGDDIMIYEPTISKIERMKRNENKWNK